QSLGKIRVAIPDVTGQSEHAAELNIRRRGLEIASMAQVEAAGIPADQVLAQNPTANAAQLVAPKISLLVSGAAEPQVYVMPNFVGQPLGSASRTLQDEGFKLGNVTVAAIVEAPTDQSGGGQAPTPPVQPAPASIIVSQNPAAGQKILAGATISFEVR
ncbi:MAG TPA: PASTA domain-containing protein, partial [Dongiaceae bacterium]|nr:PASTA domain-containing protein [Dongiaceae bacterium]